MPVIGFIGTGNMGGALARAAAKQEANRVLLTNRTQAKAEALAAEIGAEAGDPASVIAAADYLFLGVKPQMLPGLAETIAPLLKARQDRFVLVTMAAGTAIEKLLGLLGGEWPVIRIMPNTPASIGQGMILYTCGAGVTAEEEQCFLAAMAHAGRFLKLEERLIDAGSAVSGSGPAFADLMIEALADGGVACGLPRAACRESRRSRWRRRCCWARRLSCSRAANTRASSRTPSAPPAGRRSRACACWRSGAFAPRSSTP